MSDLISRQVAIKEIILVLADLYYDLHEIEKKGKEDGRIRKP